MEVYHFILLVVFVSLGLFFVPSKQFQALLAMCLCLFLGFFAGSREIGIDNDSQTYELAYKVVGNPDFSSLVRESKAVSQEIGFLLILKCGYNLSLSYESIQLLMNIFSMFMFGLFLIKVGGRPVLGVLIYYLLFYYYRDFTQIRFCIASVLSMWGIYYWISDGKVKIGSVFLLISVLIHNSALIAFLPILFAYLDLHLRKKAIFVIAGLAASMYFVKLTTTLLVKLIDLPEQVLRYLDVDDGGGGISSIFLGLFLSLMIVFCNKNLDSLHRFAFYTLFASFVAGMMFSDLSILLRMQLLLFTNVVIIPSLNFGKYKWILVLLIVAASFRLYFVNMNESLVRPYEIWWSL